MKAKSLMRALINTLIIGSVGLIFYFIIGQNYVKFYSGGKTEILEVAVLINKLCNDNRSCPATLEGWEKSHDGRSLSKNNMLYFVTSGNGGKDDNKGKDSNVFRLVYRFFGPDHWFEAQGGVDKTVTSGWKNR